MHTSIMSSFLFDDDFSHCNWSPSSPKRCDRGQSFCMDSMAHWILPLHASSSTSNSTRSREHLFSFCTEELGSESTSGAGHASTAPMSHSNPNIFYEDHIATMPAEAVGQMWASMHQPHTATTSEEAIPIAVGRKPLQTSSSEYGDDLSQYIPKSHWRRSGNVQTFPPPLPSLLCDRPLMRSFKSNGRFTLKRIDNVSRSLFRSTRKDGRLRLDLLSSSYDGLHDQCSLLFPANPAGLPPMSASSTDRHHYPLYIPPIPSCNWNSNSTLGSHSYDPQALAILIHSKSPVGSSPVKVPKPAVSCSSSSSGHTVECATNVKTSSPLFRRLPAPHVFALLNLLPAGLGLIILLEFGQSQYGNFVTLHGVYILKGLGLLWTIRDGVVLSKDPFFTNLCGIGVKVPEGNLFPI